MTSLESIKEWYWAHGVHDLEYKDIEGISCIDSKCIPNTINEYINDLLTDFKGSVKERIKFYQTVLNDLNSRGFNGSDTWALYKAKIEELEWILTKTEV